MAVSGAALAQGKPKLTLGGSTEQIFGVGSNSDAFDKGNGARVGFDQHSDTEIHFKGSVTLDNGIKIVTRTELEGESIDSDGTSNTANGRDASKSADFIDETWMRISGSFGEVRAGSGDPAAMAMTTGYLGAWSTNVGQNHAFDVGDWVTKPSTVSASTVGRVDITSDAEHVSYFTPRFSGFQAGISYIPSTQEDVNNQRALKNVKNSAGAITTDTDGWSFGVNYVGKFDGVGVGAAAGYVMTNESSPDRDDDSAWGVGLRVDFQGFRVGLSWVANDEQGSKTSNEIAAPGQDTFEAGVRYAFGPNALSLSYLNAETTASSGHAADGDEIQLVTVAYRRTLGPGVFWKVTGFSVDYDDAAKNTKPEHSNDGEALTTSIQVRF